MHLPVGVRRNARRGQRNDRTQPGGQALHRQPVDRRAVNVGMRRRVALHQVLRAPPPSPSGSTLPPATPRQRSPGSPNSPAPLAEALKSGEFVTVTRYGLNGMLTKRNWPDESAVAVRVYPLTGLVISTLAPRNHSSRGIGYGSSDACRRCSDAKRCTCRKGSQQAQNQSGDGQKMRLLHEEKLLSG